jgi:hypothetical protein
MEKHAGSIQDWKRHQNDASQKIAKANATVRVLPRIVGVPTVFSTKFIISWSKSLFLQSGGRGRPVGAEHCTVRQTPNSEDKRQNKE